MRTVKNIFTDFLAHCFAVVLRIVFKKTLPLVLSLLVLLVQSIAVSDEAEEMSEEKTDWVTVDMPFAYQNIQVPRELWERIKEILKADGVSKKKIDSFVVLPTSINVEITSDSDRVTKKGKKYLLKYIEGGGEVDLFDYIEGRGAFHMRFSPGLTNDNVFHLLYISDSPFKKVGGDTWGNGCGRILDLTGHADKFIYDPGMNLTTSRKLNMYVMAGTFIFFQLVDERMYLGYIRVKDSRYPQFRCKED